MDGGAPDVIVCMITGGGSDVDLETLMEQNYDVDLFILDFDPSPEVLAGGANIQVAPSPAAPHPLPPPAAATATTAPITTAAAATAATAHPDT